MEINILKIILSKICNPENNMLYRNVSVHLRYIVITKSKTPDNQKNCVDFDVPVIIVF